MAGDAVTADGLTKRFRGVLALDRVSIAVPPGSVFGLLGPNGAGKTTLIRILTTLLRPEAGTASILGFELLERFRSLPMSRVAVLAGRALADLARNIFVVALMMGVGFAVGFRIHHGVGSFAWGFALVLAFGFAMSWIFAVVGLVVADPESAMAAGFLVMAPLVFASAAFIPVSTMPGWLQAFAAHQPVSYTAEAIRALVLGGPVATYVWQSLAWLAGIIAVFAPLGAWRYHHAA